MANDKNKPDAKIIDLISNNETGKPYVSLEYFPPRTEVGVKNLYKRMDRMKKAVEPIFSDITWGAGGSTADLSLTLALHMQKTGHVANLHMTCTNIQGESPKEETAAEEKKPVSADPKQKIKDALQEAYDGNIRNIVALRGDPPAGQEEWKAAEGGFTCALDLVKFIREEFGSDYGISVAGYPEGHPNAISEVTDFNALSDVEKARSSTFDGKTYCCLEADYKKEMDYLKLKVDAGADLIITQMFFDVKVFKQFVEDCHKWGINCPIVPGLMCINAYPGFIKMTNFCKTRVPTDLKEKMEALNALEGIEPKEKDAKVKAFGIEYGAQMCRELMEINVPVLHFYTLNLEKVVYGILDELGLSKTGNLSSMANEKDASTMVAKGSAWARVGDEVQTIYGSGIVQEIRKDGSAKIEIQSWLMANDQKPIAVLGKDSYKKIFETKSSSLKVGDAVSSIYGRGIIQELRSDGSAVIEIQSWLMANDQKPLAILGKDHYSSSSTTTTVTPNVGDQVKTIYGTGIVKEVRTDGTASIEIHSWLMANEQKPVAYLGKDSYAAVS